MPSSSRVVDSTKKRGGTKQKIEIKKRETKQQRAVACSKRRRTVFSKAAELCLHSGANIAVFVTSPSEISDVVYSFSGFSPAYEIADCYLKNKPPPKIVNPDPKLGFWWDDPDLYSSCEDLSELNIIEDRLQRAKKYVLACLEKKDTSHSVSDFDQNPNGTCSLDEDCGGSSSSQIAPNPSLSVDESCGDQTLACFHGDQNPNSTSQSSSQIVAYGQNAYSSLDQICGESSSQVASFDPNPNSTAQSSSQIVPYHQNAYSSLDQINGESCSQVASFDPNPSFEIQGVSSASDQSYFVTTDGLGCDTEEDNNNQINLLQETDTQAMISLEDLSFWDGLFNDDVFALNSDFPLDTRDWIC